MTHSERITERLAQLDRDAAWLGRLVGINHSTLSRRIRRNNWTRAELERVYLVLHITEHDIAEA